MKFSKILNELIAENEITVKSLKESTGIAESTLYYYLEDKAFANLNALIKLSDYFNCSIDFLLGLTDIYSYSKPKHNKTFPEIYKELLKEHKTNNQKVSRELGISRARYYTWKNGSQPSVTILMQLSKYFNVSIDYLIGRSEDC